MNAEIAVITCRVEEVIVAARRNPEWRDDITYCGANTRKRRWRNARKWTVISKAASRIARKNAATGENQRCIR